jgi:hypothetical protein
MLSTCPPHVTGVALAVSSCRRPDTTGTSVSVSYCLTARYCWYCAGRLKLSTTRYYCNGTSPQTGNYSYFERGNFRSLFLARKNIATL